MFVGITHMYCAIFALIAPFRLYTFLSRHQSAET